MCKKRNVNKLENFNIDTAVSVAFIALGEHNDAETVLNNLTIEDASAIYKKMISTGRGEYGSLFELEWRQGCDNYLEQHGFKNKDAAKKLFEEKIVDKINLLVKDAHKFVPRFGDAQIICDFKPYWYEDVPGNLQCDELFYEAVIYAAVLLENWTREIYEETEVRTIENDIWHNAELKAQDGIFILDERIPWQYQIKQNPDTQAKVIICKSSRGGYNVMSKDKDEVAIGGIEYLTYLHPTFFMGVADSLENAILSARESIAMAPPIAK